MIIVTGGSGFIGSNIVKSLNERGIDNILVIDDLTNAEKVRNLTDLRTIDYSYWVDFSRQLEKGELPKGTQAVLHQGACSDTLATDGRSVMEANFTFSKILLKSCVNRKIPLIYASSAAVYGKGSHSSVDQRDERPLNVYGYSKYLFDRLVNERIRTCHSQVVGLRYFNVYGPREEHKGRMASMIYQLFIQMESHGSINLFEGTHGFGNGEQRRDFISVKDVVSVNLYMLDHTYVRGIVNVGTGKSWSFNDVALAVINGYREIEGKSKLSLQEAQKSEIIRYYPMPKELERKYQSFTEANIDSLRESGFDQEITELEDGVGDYVRHLHRNI